LTNQNHQDKSESNNAGGFLAGLLLGSLAGAGVMLLLAPQSGEKTRTNIQQQGQKLREQTAESIEDGVKQVRDKAQQVTTSIQDQAEELQQRRQDVVDQQKGMLESSYRSRNNGRAGLIFCDLLERKGRQNFI
jgi:gas vesicle protein